MYTVLAMQARADVLPFLLGQGYCEVCPRGKFSTAGSSGCDLCFSKYEFSFGTGQITCQICPTYAEALLPDYITCVCSSSFYAVPYVNTDLLLALDPSGQLQIDKYDDESVYNANEILDLWCVPCPTGAKCTEPGTVIRLRLRGRGCN